MDRETLQALDFPRIREMVVDLCTTELGKEKARALEPNLDRSQAIRELERIEETFNFEGEPLLGTVDDIRTLVAQVAAGGVLTTEELLRVRSVCAGLRECQRFLLRNKERVLHLAEIAAMIVALPELERALDRAIDDSGAVRDTATPRLKELREELRARRNLLVARLERMQEENSAWFEGPVMVRRERFVLPVKLEYRNQVPGVVHSTSASGQTIFVEPLETIAEQNRLQELRDAENEEINRVRRELSVLVARFSEEIYRGLEGAARLDFLLAKKRFALKFNCVRPVVSPNDTIEIKRARHPLLLLHKKEVVPLDFHLPSDKRVVVISGPNAGGKTVVLKTLGLCALLLKSGMFVPAAAGTKLPWWERVFADIGDEQSLEANRSSFSAHLLRVKEILEGAGPDSLVLVDEIGAATAPEEGTALAIAILQELRQRKVTTIATTHFNNLKMFVQNEPGMLNAAMEFRNEPTYRLIMGIPGESSAFEIAERLGLPVTLLERAKKLVGSEWLDLRRKLQAVADELHAAEEARRKMEKERTQATALIAEYEQRLREFQEWQKQERRRFIEEQERWLRETRRQVENLVRELREKNADRESVIKTKRFLDEKLTAVDTGEEVPDRVRAEPQLAIGNVVESKVFRRRGRVVAIEGKEVVVSFGQIKMRVMPDTLVRVEPDVSSCPPVPVEEFEFVPRLNIRGMTKEDAEIALERFLAEAEAAGVRELSVLHGKGTGTLRRMLWTRLRKDRRVSDVRFAEPAEGGMGVTLIKLRGRDDQA